MPVIRCIEKVLVANRGEIAVRIIKACRELGIASVALYTDADRSWTARDLADEAVHIGHGPAAESYIDIEKVIAVAKRTGADAIHPGYGFLSENAKFAKRCVQEGLVFIGPSADVIDLMGNKAKAKALVSSLDIPIIPGFDTVGVTDEVLSAMAGDIGYPLMIKAVSGGGGMGIRIAHREGDLDSALLSVRHEAKAAFGDDRVLVEKYFPAIRHIEVQVLADRSGKVVHCYERECSVQRRHQKIIEEAPSEFVSDRLREKLCAASVKIAEAVGYEGVGTVEFVVEDVVGTNEPNENYYFLEMNTRLQVEHGVTEAVTGIDLVREQINVAEGRCISFGQADITLQGFAMECRLCAENPAKDFMPVVGTVHTWSAPEGKNVRVDTGIREGTNISVYYDSLIAKVITTGDTREQVIRSMRSSLQNTVILGFETNQQFLLSMMKDTCFNEGRVNTTYIEQNETLLLQQIDSHILDEMGAIAALVSAQKDTQKLRPGQGGTYIKTYSLLLDDTQLFADLICQGPCRYRVALRRSELEVSREYELQVDMGGENLRVSIDGVEKSYRAKFEGTSLFIHLPGTGCFTLAQVSLLSKKARENTQQEYTAAMAGQVTAVLARPGMEVQVGDSLLVIESMKMEHCVVAHSAGTIESVEVGEGDAIAAKTTLLSVI